MVCAWARREGSGDWLSGEGGKGGLHSTCSEKCLHSFVPLNFEMCLCITYPQNLSENLRDFEVVVDLLLAFDFKTNPL